MPVMDVSMMALFGDALKAAQAGDKHGALVLADRYASASITAFEGADATGKAMIVAPLVELYEMIGEWELAALKSRDVCALAEKLCPNTSETAGDYTHLADALERLGDCWGALQALENATRHLKGAGIWERYAKQYEQNIARLRRLHG